MLLSERVGASGEPKHQKRDRALIFKNLGSTVAFINKFFGHRGLLKQITPGGNRGGYPRLQYCRLLDF
jgi:hypothetical protein